MQGFSRVLTVLIAVISIAFMGFAGVAAFSGPNWEAELKALKGYTFRQSPGENPVWSATRIQGGEELSPTSPLAPAVLVTAMEDRQRVAQEELQRLQSEVIPNLEAQRDYLEKMAAADLPALESKIAQERERLTGIDKQVEATAMEQDALAKEVAKLEDQLDSRRDDVFRLALQHQVLVADIVRIQQNVQVVDEQIRLIEDELDKAYRREQVLREQGIE